MINTNKMYMRSKMNLSNASKLLSKLKPIDQWWKSDFRILKYENVDEKMEKIENINEK